MSEAKKDGTELVAAGPTTTAIAGVTEVYEGGSLMPLGVDEIFDNKVAVKQLINSHNSECKKRVEAESKLAQRDGEIEYLKTSPFVAIIGAVLSVGGSLVISLGIQDSSKHEALLVVVGAALVLTGSLANILYPFARRWFNRTTNPR